MTLPHSLTENSDSLIALLGAQCTDLEKLLLLAREETLAAQEGKFLRIWEIVSERASIGQRLETFQRQIAELRGHLESQGEDITKFDATQKVIELANHTLLQDQQTKKLLTAARENALSDLNNLERSSVRANAYLKEQTKGLAYDGSF